MERWLHSSEQWLHGTVIFEVEAPVLHKQLCQFCSANTLCHQSSLLLLHIIIKLLSHGVIEIGLKNWKDTWAANGGLEPHLLSP